MPGLVQGELNKTIQIAAINPPSMYLALNDVKKASARRNPRSSSRYADTITIMANYDPDVFRSMQVDLGSKTPYSDATQVGFQHFISVSL